MEAKHIITQVIGTVATVVLARWGWKEFRRDWRQHGRLPLVTGPFIGGWTVVAVVGAIALLVLAFVAILNLELVPKGNPGAFVAMLAWASLAFVFLILGLTTLAARRYAKGWITLLGDGSLRVDAGGVSATFKLAPGLATLRFIEVKGDQRFQYVQLDLDDGRQRAHVWGMVGIRDLKLVTKEYVAEAEGLMAATSMGPLCRQLAPYLTKR
jgi:hypothetical protein